jgi:hypothetical protein
MFKIQKNYCNRSTDTCRDLSKNLKILPFQSQYRLSLFFCVVQNKNKFTSKSDIYNIYFWLNSPSGHWPPHR